MDNRLSETLNHQPAQDEPINQQRAFWASIIFTCVALISFVFSVFLVTKSPVWQVYAILTTTIIALGVDITATIFIWRGQTSLGLKLLFWSVLTIVPVNVLLVTNTTLALIGIVLVVGSVHVFYLQPRSWRKHYRYWPIVVSILMVIVELNNPVFRVNLTNQTTTSGYWGPIMLGFLLVSLVALIIHQAWNGITSFWRLSIRNRLTAIVVGSALIPVVLISVFLGGVTYVRVRESLVQTTFDRLDAIEEIKTNQLSSYFAERENDMFALSNSMGSLLTETLEKMEAINTLKRGEILRLFEDWDTDVREVGSTFRIKSGMRDLAIGFQSLGASQARAIYMGHPEIENAGDVTAYSLAHAEQHSFFLNYIEIHEYEDAFLIDLYGNVVYSVYKTDLYGTNLLSGPYQNSNLAKLYSNLVSTQDKKSYFADIDLVGETYAMFIGAPIYDSGTKVGILVYQISTDAITSIMAERSGQGLTGESFLIAMEDDGSISYRSNRTSIGNEKFVVGYDITDIASPTMRKALGGTSGGGLIAASTGETRINAYRPLDIEGVNWAVFTSVNANEALSPSYLEGEKDYLFSYRETYGYYDIFLIHPNGTIFYTVAQEPDFQTNILTGPYSNSNLATLVNEVIEEKNTEFVDFAFYEPSGGVPAAFLASPVLDAEGNIVLIVAAQVSIGDINQIMNEAHGLGETGESYIIGQDFLGRMDSRFIEQFGVETTVLNPDYAVDTEAVRSALSGNSGQDTIIDYRGLPVVSVWRPFTIHEPDAEHPEGQIWAIMTEIDESEALTPVNQLAGGLGVIIGLATLFVGALAVFLGIRFAQAFVKPVLNLTDTATQVAAGNLDLRVTADSVDEIGTLTTTFNDMTSRLQDTLEGLEQRVANRTKALATSAEVTRRLAAILDPRQLVSEVVEQIQRAYDFYYTQIYLLDETGANLVIAGGTGEAGASMLARKHSVPKGRGLVGRAADANASVLIPDVSQEEGWLPNEMLPETRAEAAIPISIGNQVLGVLDVQHSLVNGLTADDVTLLESLAGQVAISLQNARSYDRSRKQAELESLVNVIGQRIQRTTSIEETLQTAIHELGTAIGASRVKANIRPTFGKTQAESVMAKEATITKPERKNGSSPSDPESTLAE